MLDFHFNPDNFTDWTGLHALLTECFAYMDARIDPPSSLKKFNAKGLEQKAQDETLIIVHDAEKLIACAFLRTEADKVYIGKVAVSPDCQGRGIGRKIFDMAKNFTRQQGKKTLELETRIELVENHKAFATMGFEKTGENAHAGYNRPTSITMQCKV